eukprot:TRINITY_DN16586_c0_g1_i1.p1 TRINITY_DN16586_c0_g1~~TRINITY_DN16586_c0_g1_i1.p1  ORF type:complete len:336 (-),score=80.28 TRINITY_DN16586_c0_g1_i1:70-1077(-)
MGTACGKGTCAPSPTPKSPKQLHLFNNCQACDLRGSLCDLCAASTGPAPSSLKLEPAAARSFEPSAAECAPSVVQNPDWYDPGFQQPRKIAVHPKKLKALRDEFEEEEEEAQPAAQGHTGGVGSPVDEFQYTEARHGPSEPQVQPQVSQVAHTQSAADCFVEEIVEEDWEQSPVLLQPAPAGFASQNSAVTMQSVLRQLVSAQGFEACEAAFQNPWAPGSAHKALLLLAEGSAPEFKSKLAQQAPEWQDLFNSGITAIIDAVVLPILQCAAEDAPKSIEQLAASVKRQLEHTPGLGAGVGAAVRGMTCLLYTSDAADEEDSVDLGGRRILKKKKK